MSEKPEKGPFWSFLFWRKTGRRFGSDATQATKTRALFWRFGLATPLPSAVLLVSSPTAPQRSGFNIASAEYSCAYLLSAYVREPPKSPSRLQFVGSRTFCIPGFVRRHCHYDIAVRLCARAVHGGSRSGCTRKGQAAPLTAEALRGALLPALSPSSGRRPAPCGRGQPASGR
jgi:hypothetical protein